MRKIAMVACAAVLLASNGTGFAAEWGGTVKSSWLDVVKYDPETQVLRVQMKNSTDVYEYSGVPQEVALELLAAESVGTYYAQKISGHYEMSHLEE